MSSGKFTYSTLFDAHIRLIFSLLNDQLKLSMLIEVKCIHGNDSSKCEKELQMDELRVLELGWKLRA